MEASADVSLFKYNWDPSLIPVTVPDEKHNLSSTFLILSQTLSLIYTNTSIYQEHCLKMWNTAADFPIDVKVLISSDIILIFESLEMYFFATPVSN